MFPASIVDAHFHVWDAETNYHPWLRDRPVAFRYGDYSALPRRYLVADYRRDAVRWPIVRGVYIEAEWDPDAPAGEMDFIGSVRGAEGFPTVAIAQAWLDRDDCAAALESHAARGFVRGVRHKPKAGQMDDGRWRAGFARLAREFPETTIVVNHAGLPPATDRSAWQAAMGGLAPCGNIAVKISGLGNLDKPARREVTLTLIEQFGVQRVMFASNYPVDSLRDSFDTIWRTFDEITGGFSDDERRALFHDNAMRIYRML